MNILFVTERASAGSCLMRAVWPALWIQKFTEHDARWIDHVLANQQQARHLLGWADIVVCHKQHDMTLMWAELAKQAGKKLIFETDDIDEIGFGNYYNGYYLLGFFENLRKMISMADGVTVSSRKLKELTDHDNIEVIENGFDLTLPCYDIKPKPYFSSPAGDAYKISWGGGTSHGRDFEWFFKAGIVEALNDRYPIDWYIYGLDRWQPHKRPIGKGSISYQHAVDVEMYLNRLYSNATLTIAPLVIDDFNSCRSSLKLVEAGVAGKTCVASAVESYKDYPGGAVLVDNTADAWISAISNLLDDKEKRTKLERKNRRIVKKHFDAKTLTEKRIAFYQTILEA